MRAPRLRLLVGLLATLTASSLLAFPFPSRSRGVAPAPEPPPPLRLQSEMSPEAYAAAGLHKLTDAERASLEAWINSRQAQATEAATEQYIARGESGFGLEEIPDRTRVPVDTPEEIQSSIAGPFRGWSGNTILRLTNGQVWQTDRAPEFAISTQDPEVTIRRGSFGTYSIQISGYGTRTRVKRIE